MLHYPQDEKLIGRLFNFKFAQAEQYLRKDHPEHIHRIVKALSAALGNSGYDVEGAVGAMAHFIVEILLRGAMAEEIAHDP